MTDNAQLDSEQIEETSSPDEPAEAGAGEETSAASKKLGRRGLLRRWAVDIMLFIILFMGISWWHTRGTLDKNQPVPEVSFQTLDGDTVTLDELTEGPILLHFWAVWCGVCKLETGSLNRLSRALSGDAKLIAVALNDRGVDAVRAFMDEYDVEYEVIIASPQTVRAFNVAAYPTNYYVTPGPERRIHNVTVGISSQLTMRYRLWRAGMARGGSPDSDAPVAEAALVN